MTELDQYVEEDGRLKLDADNLDKLISAIQNAQGAVYLAGGVGGFPLRKKSTRQRLYRWYDLLWRQASEKFGYTDKDFHPWDLNNMDSIDYWKKQITQKSTT